jgi:hypothetical protein
MSSAGDLLSQGQKRSRQARHCGAIAPRDDPFDEGDYGPVATGRLPEREYEALPMAAGDSAAGFG